MTPADSGTIERRPSRLAFLEPHLDLLVFVAALMSIPVAAQPDATTGDRIGAVFLMVLGVAFLGTIAATLASLFVGEEEDVDDELAQLRGEVAELRRSIDALTARLDR